MSSTSQYFISIGCVAAGLSCMTFGSCSTPVKTAELSSPSDAKVIEAVRTHQQRHGRDPRKEEITATWDGAQWQAISWHIVHPENQGSSRFVPGGMTYYTVSPENEIVSVTPGR